jgi:nucleotide-binding universal stress UspA family protein
VKRVLVAVDDSDASHRAATFVNYFFDGMDVEILAVNVAPAAAPWIPSGVFWGALYAWPYDYWAVQPELLVDAEREAEKKSEQTVLNSGLQEAKPIVEVGDPVMAIQRAADERNVDLIIVGSHDKNLLQRIVSPSVSRELAHHATRPVLIVP